MGRVRVSAFTVSVDGYGAGPCQDLDNPLGVGGKELHGWMIATRTFRAMIGQEGGTTGLDDDLTRRGMEGVGAWILGRNMFGPSRGPWPDDAWKGWWGEEPPYRAPVFVLTRHARAPIPMKGGTTFHFVTGGIAEALERAKDAAGDADVRVGGGVDTIRQFVRGRLLDEMHVAIAPVVLGEGEHLLAGLDLPALGYRVARHEPSASAMHVVFERSA